MTWKLRYGQKMAPIKSIIYVNILVFSYCSWIAFTSLKNSFIGYMLVFQLIASSINQGFMLEKYFLTWRILDYTGAIILTYHTIPIMIEIMPVDLFILASSSNMLMNYAQLNATTANSHIILMNIWHLQIAYLFALLGNFSKNII